MSSRKGDAMSKTVPFDTLAYAKKLEANGVAVKQAEAHAEVLAEILESTFTSKNDSNMAINGLAQEIDSLSKKFDREMSSLSNKVVTK